jgi:hypothetical protein
MGFFLKEGAGLNVTHGAAISTKPSAAWVIQRPDVIGHISQLFTSSIALVIQNN